MYTKRQIVLWLIGSAGSKQLKDFWLNCGNFVDQLTDCGHRHEWDVVQ